MRKLAALAAVALLSGTAHAAPPAAPTKLYRATVLNVSYHFCVVTTAGAPGLLPITEGNCTGAPTGVPERSEYDYLEGQLQIDGRVYKFQFDNLPHAVCYQTSDTTRCSGTAPNAALTTNFASFGYVQGHRGTLKTVLENLVTTKGRISLQVVPSAISDPSLGTQLDASNVRFLDDGVGDRFLAVVRVNGSDSSWDQPSFPDFAK